MRKKLIFLLASFFILTLTSCGEVKYKDGTYIGEYLDDPIGEKMAVEIVIKNNKIKSCKLESYTKDGVLKDETYGDDQDENDKKRAKVAYDGIVKYPKELVKHQDIDKVDVICGATTSYNEFRIAVEDALRKARE